MLIYLIGCIFLGRSYGELEVSWMPLRIVQEVVVLLAQVHVVQELVKAFVESLGEQTALHVHGVAQDITEVVSVDLNSHCEDGGLARGIGCRRAYSLAGIAFAILTPFQVTRSLEISKCKHLGYLRQLRISDCCPTSFEHKRVVLV